MMSSGTVGVKPVQAHFEGTGHEKAHWQHKSRDKYLILNWFNFTDNQCTSIHKEQLLGTKYMFS